MVDWADKIAANYARRGETVLAEELRETVRRQCESNSHLCNPEDPESVTVETERLIGLQQKYDERDELEYQYAQKGILITPDYSHEGKIGSVKLPFTPEEWVDLLNREGESLHMCCANISRIRDILQDACRDGGYIKGDELFEAYHLAKGHDCSDDSDDGPISKMMKLWETIEKDFVIRRGGITSDINNPEDALRMLYHAAGTITWENMGSKEYHDDDRWFAHHANCNYALATVKAAVHTLYYKLPDFGIVVEGYGLFGENNEIAHARNGLAIYRTIELATEICDRWNRTVELATEICDQDEKYVVKKVRVTMENGLEVVQ